MIPSMSRPEFIKLKIVVNEKESESDGQGSCPKSPANLLINNNKTDKILTVYGRPSSSSSSAADANGSYDRNVYPSAGIYNNLHKFSKNNNRKLKPPPKPQPQPLDMYNPMAKVNIRMG